MTDGITDDDLQTLFAQNPLAAEQLRRIIAERHRDELRAEIEALKGESNGVAEAPAVTRPSAVGYS